jgi:hypothetical protein
MRIIWDDLGNRNYISGISQGVLYPEKAPGVPWNGLVSVTESGEDAGDTRYFDGQKYHIGVPGSIFSGTISAYTYPDEFEPCIGISGIFTAQQRKSFSFSYRNNSEIHVVYNALAATSKPVYSSLSEEISPALFEWPFTTQPVKIPGGKPSSHIVIMTDECDPATLYDLEALIYGDDVNDPVLPTVSQILAIFESYMVFQVTDNGDGTWTADGPGTMLSMLDSETFQINSSSTIFLDDKTYTISSSD